MAKKDNSTTKTSASADGIFKQLISQHNKISAGIATIGTDMDSEIKDYINSGSLLLNMILSNNAEGGWPAGRIVEVFGKESIGKSTLGYVLMANTQRQGGIPIYADIERAGNKKFMNMLGVDLNKLIITHEETIEKLFSGLEENLKTIIDSGLNKKPNAIIVDSVTALQTDAEFEQGYEYNMNIQMKKAMMLGKALKKIVPYLNKANCVLYLVNQIRDNTSGYGVDYVVPGGKSIPFYASIRLLLKGMREIKAKDINAENEFQEAMAAWKALPKDSRGDKPERAKLDEMVIGHTIEAYTVKNKTSPPKRTAHFNIIFSKGLFDEECYLEYCEKFGIIKASGAWKQFVHPDITSKFPDLPKFYASSWLDILTSNDGLYEMVEKMLINKLTIPIDGDVVKFSVDTEEDGDEYNLEKLNKEKVEDEN